MSATPQPEPSSAPLSALPSVPGTPGANSSGLNSAVQRLKVEGTMSPRSGTGTPTSRGKGSQNGDGSDTDDEDEGGHKAAAEQRRRDEEDLRNLERQAKLDAEGPPKEVHAPQTGEEEISAADYDPEDQTMFDDRKERERLFMNQNEQISNQAKYAVVPPSAQSARPMQSAEPTQAEEGEDDDDDDDDDDMFAITSKKVKKKPRLDTAADTSSKTAYVPIINRASGTTATSGDGATAPLIVDNFDDAEGYYRVILGEVMDGDRYHLTAHLGKGMFSNVVRARDRHSPLPKTSETDEVQYREVAIKIMRSQESM